MIFRKTQDPGPAPEAVVDKQCKQRLLAVKIILLLAFVVAALRLVQIQVIEAPKFKEIAKRQYEARVVLPATRGDILDRNGSVLVSNSMFVSYAADPKIVGDAAPSVARRFSRMFGKPESYYLQRLRSTKRFVWLERRVRPDVAKAFNGGAIEGVVELNEPKRLYHYDEIGGQTIGCTNIDNVGISGVEYEFDNALRGLDGFVIMQRDGLGRKRPSFDYPRQDPVDGHSITLTLDIGYQSIVEEELKKGIARAKADDGVAIMIDPATGEVLAMAHAPSVNPNTIEGVSMELLRDRAVADMVEPGSVFKVVTASAALDHHLVSPGQMFFGENGTYRVTLPGGRIRVITDTHESGMITFQHALEVSSNIVFAKISDVIGAERLYTQARDFGFGMTTGIELPGEASGDLKKPVEWSGATLNSMGYGYEVAVTPIQIAMAYAAVANGGILMKPYLLERETDEHGEVVRTGEPQEIRRVVSRETAQTLRDFFVGVVEHGTGAPAKIPGITIAGKTGTARKYVNGHYESGNYNATFVGFFPAEKPQIVLLVLLDNPRAGGYTGALASAPIFRAIAERIINNNGVFSRSTADMAASDTTLIVVPDVCNLHPDAASEILESSRLDWNTIGKGALVLRQSPVAGQRVQQGTVVQLVTDGGSGAPVIAGGLPDLRGMSMRRALGRLAAGGYVGTAVGSGVVISQYPAAGSSAAPHANVTVVCEPRSIMTARLY